MDPVSDEPTLHSLDKALAAHVAGCTQESTHMWSELRALKHAVWAVFGFSGITLVGLVAYFGAIALKLHV